MSKLTTFSREQAVKMVNDGFLFVCNHSGGKDSQAMYLFLKEFVPAKQLLIIHADLGKVEWGGLKEHINNTTNGEDFIVANPYWKDGTRKDLLEEVERKHEKNLELGRDQAPWPSPSIRWCTSGYKASPINREIRRYMKKHGLTKVVSCMGVRGDESGSRAKGMEKALFDATGEVVVARKHKELNKAGRVAYEWHPIFDWTEEQVFKKIEDAGQLPHEMYLKGMSRLSCAFCIMASKKDLTIAAQHAPKLYKEYVDLEKKVGYSMIMPSKGKPAKFLEEITGINADDIQPIEENKQAS